MIKLPKIKNETLCILALCALAVITHLTWFNLGSTITNSDWGYYNQNVLNELYKNFGPWSPYSNFGGLNVQLPFYVFMSVWSFLGHLGLNYDVITKLTFFIPIAILNFVSPYLLLRSIFKDNMASFMGALFYGTTTYGISNQPPLQLVYALAPLIVLMFRKAIIFNDVKSWLSFVLIYSLGIVYEVRIMYIVTAVLVLYFIIFHIRDIKRVPLSLGGSGAAIILLNVYWLIPSTGGATASKITQVANRGLFGNDLFDISHAITLSNWYWTGGVPNNSFVLQPVQPVLWLIPVLIIVGIILASRKVHSTHAKKSLIFFLVISITGITLTKQIADPIPNLYPWLYAHLPGFNLFREASKFFILTAFGYCGLVTLTLVVLKKSYFGQKKYVYLAGILAVVLVVGSNIKPTMTGEIGGLFVPRHYPEQYSKLNSSISNLAGDFKTFWVPTTSRFSYQSQNKPAVSGISVSENDLSAYSKTDDQANQRLIFQNIVEPFLRPFSESLFDIAGIKYVIVPLRDIANDDDFYEFYGNDRSYFTEILDKISWLKKTANSTNDTAIYENKNTKAYIRAVSNVFNLRDLSNLDNKYNFIIKNLNSTFDIASPGSTEPANELVDPFESLKRQQVAGSQLTYDLDQKSQKTAYINTNHFTLSYQYSNGSLSFTRKNEVGLTANKEPLGPQLRQSQLVDRTPLIENGEYVISQGDDLISIDKLDFGIRELGAPKPDTAVYSVNGTNRIVNPKFESGLWQDGVEDCNPYDNTTKINQSLMRDPEWKTNILQLKASTHAACTGPEDVQVFAGEKIMLEFNYRVKQGKRAGYELRWSGPNGTSKVTKNIIVTDSSWRTERVQITVPKGAEKLAIRLEAFPNDTKPVEGIVRYANARISGITEIDRPAISLTPTYASVAIPSDADQLQVANSTISGTNLIPNASLENGQWQKTVGDCNAYDNRPEIGMSLNSQTRTDGKYSLELYAKRHAACTGPGDIPVKEGHTYLLSFDYQSPNATKLNYHLGFNDPKFTQKGDDKTEIIDSKWHTLNKTFSVPYGATKVSLAVYAAGVNPASTKIINRYDNFRIIEIPDVAGQYFVVDSSIPKLAEPKKIDYHIVSPSRKDIRVTAATTPFYLVMGESYHPAWRLELANDGVTKGINMWSPWAKADAVSSTDHFNYGDFLNAWYVDPSKLCANNKSDTACKVNADGSYNLALIAEFPPQRMFNFGRVISGIALLIALITYVYLRRSKLAKAWSWIARKLHHNGRE